MKKCPVCQEIGLSRVILEMGLPAYECERCSGIWLSSNKYLTWQRTQKHNSSEETVLDPLLQVSDTNRAVLCPECGRILRRYKISPDIEFHLDHCWGCNGVWLDRNEWQGLKARGWHKKINSFFTEPWQRELNHEETRRRFEKIYLDKFGPEAYTEIKRIKAWLADHPQGGGLLAYLTDMNPYRGE